MPQARGHTCRVHSAWALAYDAVPEALHSRYIVAVDACLAPLPQACVLHVAGNYAVSKKHGFGTIPADRAFRLPTPRARLANGIWTLKTWARRLADKVVREFAQTRSRSVN